MFQLLTPRLILRDFVESDWPALHALCMAPEVTRYQTWLRLETEADSRWWLRDAIYHNQQQPRMAYNLAIVTKQDNQVIGWLGWGRPSDPAKGDYDFGYALHPATWGHGYMTEALRAMLAFTFESLETQSIFGECVSANRASARVMEKAGLTLTARWHEQDAMTGATEEHLRYAILYNEWVRQIA